MSAIEAVESRTGRGEFGLRSGEGKGGVNWKATQRGIDAADHEWMRRAVPRIKVSAVEA